MFKVSKVYKRLSKLSDCWQTDSKAHRKEAEDPDGPDDIGKEQRWRLTLPSIHMDCEATDIKMLRDARSCARRAVRPDKPRRWRLERREVYVRATQRKRVARAQNNSKNPNSPKGFQQSVFKGQVREGVVAGCVAKEETRRPLERNREPGNRPRKRSQRAFDEGAKATQQSRGGLLARGAGTAGHPRAEN